MHVDPATQLPGCHRETRGFEWSSAQHATESLCCALTRDKGPDLWTLSPDKVLLHFALVPRPLCVARGQCGACYSVSMLLQGGRMKPFVFGEVGQPVEWPHT